MITLLIVILLLEMCSTDIEWPSLDLQILNFCHVDVLRDWSSRVTWCWHLNTPSSTPYHHYTHLFTPIHTYTHLTTHIDHVQTGVYDHALARFYLWLEGVSYEGRIQDFGSTKMWRLRLHVRNVFFRLYEVWDPPLDPPLSEWCIFSRKGHTFKYFQSTKD